MAVSKDLSIRRHIKKGDFILISNKNIAKKIARILCSFLAVAIAVGVFGTSASTTTSSPRVTTGATFQTAIPARVEVVPIPTKLDQDPLPPVAGSPLQAETETEATVEIVPLSTKLDHTPFQNLPTAPLPKTADLHTDPALDGFIYSAEIPLSRDLQEFTYKRAAEKGLDYTIVLAVMWRESRFNASAIGYNTNGTKDSGIMQINDVNRGWLQKDHGVSNLLDPQQNIIAGTELLGGLAEEHGQYNALIAYQAGEQGMKNRLASGNTRSQSVDGLYAKSREFQLILDRTNNVVEI